MSPKAAAAALVARAVLDGFDKHHRLFRAISAAAKGRFERGDWAACSEASRARIDMYDERVREAVAAIGETFPDAPAEETWPAIKHAYRVLLYDHQQPELAETFFNSVACRLLHRRYYNNQFIFWRPAVSTEHIESSQRTWKSYYPPSEGLRPALLRMLADLSLAAPWEDLEADLEQLARAFTAVLPEGAGHLGLQLQVLSSLFCRNQTAIVVGRVLDGTTQVPFAVPLRRTARGTLYLDTLLTRPDDLHTLFSLARAYFMVDMEVPSAFVSFLAALLPHKPKAELYTTLGLQKQGKTLFYRDLFEHLKHSTDRFAIAPGVKGMVMVVFTLPSFPYVFKIIRDVFAPPKDSDRKKVMAQYQMVKHSDRVGRMADTLEYSDVAFPLARLDPTLLEELQLKASSLLEHRGDELVIKHLYIERRMIPLDVYLRSADEPRTRAALAEYGNALRQLAEGHIFPGDLLLKNFGVTRFGRVLFYDYDEISPIEECRFRDLPQSSGDDEDTAGEPWFYVGPKDVFPEEFPRFLFAEERQRKIFFEEHPDLCTARFWREQQERARAGTQEEEASPAYPPARRFAGRPR